MTDNTSFSEELLIIVDKEDNIVGHEEREKCHQGQGILHRAFSVFIFNERKQLLVQKRSAAKILWPLHWSNSVCSHPRKGDTYEEAAGRRLKEELGFQTSLRFLFKFQYQAAFKNVGSENEMCSVYIGKTNGVVRANQIEIAEWKYIGAARLSNEMLVHPKRYTPWFKIEWEQVCRYHLSKIDML